MFQGAPISWQYKLQEVPALSTAESEFISLATACQEALWFRVLLRELDPAFSDKPIEIKCDNQSAIQIMKNPGYRSRTRHIEVRHFLIRH